MLTQVMEPNAAGCGSLDAGDRQRLAKRVAKSRDRVSSTVRTGEKRRLGKNGSYVLDRERAAVNEPAYQVRS
jgi:hypothetical protein